MFLRRPGNGAWDRLLLGPARRRRRMRRALRRLDRASAYREPPRRQLSRAGHTTVVAVITTVVFAVLASTVLANSVTSLLGSTGLGQSPVFSGHGSYRFMKLQPGSTTQPVAYDPCHTIHVVLNADGGPADAQDLLLQAIARVSDASGLRLVYEGLSSRRPGWDKSSLGSVAGTAPPVLVAFATEKEVPALRGNVAGIGGSTSIGTGIGGLMRYVTGEITLDSDSFARLDARPGGKPEERAIIMHEFGHVLGLTHVKDPNEIMSSHNVGHTEFGPGDLRGLALLGKGRCF